MKRDFRDMPGAIGGSRSVAERFPFRRSRKRLRHTRNTLLAFDTIYGRGLPGSRAFTLVEVLVSLCVFAMAAVVLGASYLNVLNSYEVVARGVRVSADFGFAREQVLREPDRKKLEQGGEFETTGGGRAKWSVEIVSTNVPEVFNVVFTYEAGSANATDTVKQTQQFTLLRPTWVDDVPERDKLKADMKARIYELQGKKPQ